MKKEDKLLEKGNNLKDLASGMAAYTGASIFGPLAVFLVLGYILDIFFGTKPILIIFGLLAAFITTNILLYRKIKRLIKRIEEEDRQKAKSGKDANKEQ